MSPSTAIAERPGRPRDGFERALVVLMALSAFVFIEPAPVDLLTVLLFPLALFARRLAIPRGSAFALVCVAAFLLANLISLPVARHIDVGLRFMAITVYLLVAWVFMVGVSGKLGERAVRLVMLGWAWGAVLTVIPAIASYFGAFPFAERLAHAGRLHALFKDANVLGAWLVAPTVWATSRLVSLERSRRLPWVFVLIVCGVGVLLTYSRGAWISLGVAMLMFFGLRMVAFGSVRARVMTLLAVPVAIVLLAIALDRLADVAVVQDMLTQRLGPQHYDVDRFATQQDALQVAIEQPLGIGPGQVEKTFVRAAHNAYVRAFVENGYLGGLALVLILFGALLRSAWLAIDSRDPAMQTAMAVVAGCMAAVCVESLVIDSVHWRHTWVLAGLAWTPMLVRPSTRP
ncbi:O-antigen ligase family protein [Nannocystaceae bacterium ST9]